MDGVNGILVPPNEPRQLAAGIVRLLKDAALLEGDLRQESEGKGIGKALVDDPAQMNVTEIQDSNWVVFELNVASEEMGRIIGRGGRVVNAMRTLLRAVAGRQGKHVTLFVCSSS